MNHPEPLSIDEAEKVLLQFSTSIITSPLWTLEHRILDQEIPDVTIVHFAKRVIMHQYRSQGDFHPLDHFLPVPLDLTVLDQPLWEDLTAAMAEFLDRALYNRRTSHLDQVRVAIMVAATILLADSPFEFGRRKVYLTISRPPFILLVNRLDVSSDVHGHFWRRWSSRMQEAKTLGLIVWWNLHEY